MCWNKSWHTLYSFSSPIIDSRVTGSQWRVTWLLSMSDALRFRGAANGPWGTKQRLPNTLCVLSAKQSICCRSNLSNILRSKPGLISLISGLDSYCAVFYHQYNNWGNDLFWKTEFHSSSRDPENLCYAVLNVLWSIIITVCVCFSSSQISHSLVWHNTMNDHTYGLHRNNLWQLVTLVPVQSHWQPGLWSHMGWKCLHHICSISATLSLHSSTLLWNLFFSTTPDTSSVVRSTPCRSEAESTAIPIFIFRFALEGIWLWRYWK